MKRWYEVEVVGTFRLTVEVTAASLYAAEDEAAERAESILADAIEALDKIDRSFSIDGDFESYVISGPSAYPSDADFTEADLL